MTGAQVQDIDRLEWQHHALLLEAVELEEQASALAYHILVDGALWQSRNFTDSNTSAIGSSAGSRCMMGRSPRSGA